LMAQLMPKGVMCAETRKLHYHYRPLNEGAPRQPVADGAASGRR